MILEKKEPIIYIVSGKARSGKDTTISYIHEYYENKNLKTINLMYAGSLKEYAKKILNWDGSDETKPREFLQQLGTEIIRDQIDNDFFVKRMIEDINVYSYFYDVITISDARLIDEIEAPRKTFKNVKVIKVERPDLISELTKEQQQHRTETGLDNYNNYDFVITNDSTLEDLKTKVYDILNEVK